MSTRGYIIVQVRESAKGKSLSFDRSMLSPDIRILDDQKWNGDGFDPLTEDIWKTTENITSDYLAIYCQCDNYPTGTGAELLLHYNSYEQALNLVAGGTTEQVANSKIIYCQPRRDSLDENDYEGGNTPIQCAMPTPCESWQYLFFNGCWYVRQWGSRWYRLDKLLQLGEDADHDLPFITQYQKALNLPYLSPKREAALQRFHNLWHSMLPVGRGLASVRKS